MNSTKKAKRTGNLKNKSRSTVIVPCSFCSKDLAITRYYIEKKKYKNFYCDKACEKNGRTEYIPHKFESLEQIYSYRWTESRGYLVMRRKYEGSEKTTMFHQHRCVMEFVLGRKLENHEHVHHMNGNKSDNRPENLMVLDSSDHRNDSSVAIEILKNRILHLESILDKHGITDTPNLSTKNGVYDVHAKIFKI